MAKKKKHIPQPAAATKAPDTIIKKEPDLTAGTVARQQPAITINPKWNTWLTYSLIAVLVLMTVMSFWYGISGDEADMNAYGKAILHYFTSFGADQTALNPPKDFDRDGVLKYYGGFFDLIAALVNKVSPLQEYTTRHILNAWAGFLAIFFAAKISLRILGARMAVICTWLMFLAPFFLGHAMNNPKDVPFAAAYIAAIYYFIRFYDKLPAVKWKDYIAPILSLIIAIDIRVAGILLIPYMAVYFVLHFLFNKNERKPAVTVFKSIAIISVAGYLGASLFWPYALQGPISNPLTALAELSNFKMSLMQLYDGERVMSSDLPATYLPHNFIITNPYVLLAGLLLAPVLFFIGRKDGRSLILFAGFIFAFPLAYIIYKHSNVYHAWRHVLFIFPGAAIIAAYGWEQLIEQAKKPVPKYAVSGLLAVGMLEPAAFTVQTFPNTITYFNAFGGGVKNAYYDYEMDYYYNSVKAVCDWVIKNELPKLKPGDTITIASNASHIVSIYFSKYPQVKVSYVRFYERSSSAWDYAIFHRALVPDNMLKSKSWVIDHTLYAASVEGLPLCIVAKRPSMDDYKGFEALKAGHTDQGIAYMQQYYRLDPKNEMVDAVLAKYYMTRNQPDSAEAMVSNILAVIPGDAEASVMKGQILMSRGRGAEALTIFSDLSEKYPEAAELHFYKGGALQMTGQADAALTELNIASNDPRLRASCYRAMADILQQQGKTAEAQQLLQQIQ